MPRKKNPAIKASGSTSSKAAPLPDWVKGGGPKPPPSYTKAGKEAAAAATGSNNPDSKSKEKSSTSTSTSTSQSTLNPTPSAPLKPDPIFPPGSKTPLALLNERIQKIPGWEKPIVDVKRVSVPIPSEGQPKQDEAWSGSVTLKKVNKSDASNPFVVKFEPFEPGVRLTCPSATHARHWVSCYALFRLFSNLSLNRVLPPGPREYWQDLVAMKSSSPSTQDWKWAEDPFEAQQKREAAAIAASAAAAPTANNEDGKNSKSAPQLSKAWQEAREVRMAPALRELVEQTIKAGFELFPEAEKEDEDGDEVGKGVEVSNSKSGGNTSSISSNAATQNGNSRLESELIQMGFRKGHARSASKWVTSARAKLAGESNGESSSIVSTTSSHQGLLESIKYLSDRDSALEYLGIYCPEDDLPQALRPTSSSDPFITGAGSGKDNLAFRWSEDRLIKMAGFPREAVQAVMKEVSTAFASSSSSDLVGSQEGLTIDLLLHKLIGEDSKQSTSKLIENSLRTINIETEKKEENEERIRKRSDERLLLESILGEDRIKNLSSNDHSPGRESDFDIVTSSGKEDLRLRICIHQASSYPSVPEEGFSASLPTFYIVSTTLPAYIRLALSARLIRALKNQDGSHEDWKELLEIGEGGVILSMVEELENCWKEFIDDPPELSQVMQHIIPKKEIKSSIQKNSIEKPKSKSKPTSNFSSSKSKTLFKDSNSDSKLFSIQNSLFSNPNFISKMKIQRDCLPAFQSKKMILDLLESNRCLIISGETGCGKTTQCPQFILDDFIQKGNGSLCNIVVTQPRRVSAMGVAGRVAEERCESLIGNGNGKGFGMVGYAIRGERKAGKDCRLLFTTTGVLLRRLATGDSDLASISHVVVDEVHERSVDSDFLLLELREVLKRNKTIKVILMSATINSELFSKYFNDAPCIEIPGRTFPVSDHYLEDIIKNIDYQPRNTNPYGGYGERKTIEKQVVALRSNLEALDLNEEKIKLVESISKNDRFDYDLLASIAKYVCEKAKKEEDEMGGSNGGGAILIFMSGIGEISQAIEAVKSTVRGNINVLPLHANLPPSEQLKVFVPSKPGIRKIVVATNVAETSITIPEITYVIDSGKVKETRFEPESSLTRLVEVWASRAACRQRRGRAGRTRAGHCFKLFTRFTEERFMAPQQTPEMKRVPLESLFLQVKAMREEEDVKEFLGNSLSPPSIPSMEKALQTLVDVGAIREENGFKSKLTPLGHHLSAMPLDLRLGKLLILGSVFGCLGPLLSVAAVMSCKPLFNSPFEKKEEASKARAAFAEENSDLLCDANAYDQWMKMKSEGAPNSEVREFCEKNFISMSCLRDISAVRADLLSHLSELGFIPTNYRGTSHLKISSKSESSLDLHSSNNSLLRSLIFAGLYPSVVKISLPSVKYDASSSGAIQRSTEAKSVKYFDISPSGGRVFLHPSSTLFSTNNYSGSHLAVFKKSASGEGINSKVYLRDATESPIYSMLLFGGKLEIDRIVGGIIIKTSDGQIKLRANPRIALLCNSLRRLLDAVLNSSIENPDYFIKGEDEKRDQVIETMVALVTRDGIA